MVELAPYNGFATFSCTGNYRCQSSYTGLKWAVEEMERRYKLFAHYHVRNITAFNKSTI